MDGVNSFFAASGGESTPARLKNIPSVHHGFFTREGGVSEGIYASLNCGPGSGDKPEAVAENRMRVLMQMMDDRNFPIPSSVALNTLYQIHSAHVVTVTAPWQQPPQADAMVTKTPGLALGILTADCAPVLFADMEAKIIGAAHAGWKGALGGVLEATVAAMENLGAKRERIVAAIGPCIHQASYEVGTEFRENFLQHSEASARWFIPSPRGWPSQNNGCFLFDLPGYAASRLREAGLAQVDTLPHDTYPDAQRFFSFRRTTHRKEPDYGRQISVICLISAT